MAKVKSKYFVAGFGILLLLTISFWIYFKRPFSDSGKQTKYVAYIGRYMPPKDAKVKTPKFDLLHEVTLRSYVNKIELSDTKFELKAFSCRKRPKGK